MVYFASFPFSPSSKNIEYKLISNFTSPCQMVIWTIWQFDNFQWPYKCVTLEYLQWLQVENNIVDQGNKSKRRRGYFLYFGKNTGKKQYTKFV